MINCDIIKHFIFQLKIKQFDMFEFYASMSKFKMFDNIILCMYFDYIMLIKIIDQTNYVNLDRFIFIAKNIINIALILKLF